MSVPDGVEAELAAAIAATRDGDPPPDFEAWAFRVFAHQYARERAVSRASASGAAITPATIARWEDVPAVPTAAFRDARPRLRAGRGRLPHERHDARPGRPRAVISVPHLGALPRLGARRLRALRPARSARGLPAVFLAAAAVAPARLVARPHVRLGRRRAGDRAASGSSAAEGLDIAAPARPARAPPKRAARRCSWPASTAAFVAALRRLPRRPSHSVSRPSSRVMDTGGREGSRAAALPRRPSCASAGASSASPGYYCVNEYGMTELCSQRYDERPRRSLRTAGASHRAGSSRRRGSARGCSIPTPSAPVAPGATGSSAITISPTPAPSRSSSPRTSAAAVGDDGIEVLGRVPGAPPRGCGLLLADLAGLRAEPWARHGELERARSRTPRAGARRLAGRTLGDTIDALAAAAARWRADPDARAPRSPAQPTSHRR